MMRAPRGRRHALILAGLPSLVLVPVLALAARPAVAAETVGETIGRDPLRALAALLLAAALVLGVGAALAVLRVLFPRVAAAADRGVVRVGALELLVAGVLPLVGALLLAQGVHALGVRALEVVYLLVVGIPLALLLVTGAAAAVPHVGGALLGREGETSLLARFAVGALVLGLSMVTWAVPPVGGVMSVLLLALFLASGLFSLGRGAAEAPGPRQA